MIDQNVIDLLDDMRDYMTHHQNCAFYIWLTDNTSILDSDVSGVKCTCGFDEVEERFAALMKELK